LPEAPGDDAPTLTGATSQLPAVAVTLSRKRSLALPSAIGGVALAVVLAVFLWPRNETKTETVASAAAVTAPPVLPPGPTSAEAPPANVVVTLRAEPASATWSIDDGPPLANPHKLEATQGAAPRRVRASAPGYEAVEQQVSFETSKDVVLSLNKEAPEVATGRPRAPRRPSTAAQAGAAAAAGTTKVAPAASGPGGKRKIRTLDQDNPFAPKTPEP
jgi:hypothetical protein